MEGYGFVHGIEDLIYFFDNRKKAEIKEWGPIRPDMPYISSLGGEGDVPIMMHVIADIVEYTPFAARVDRDSMEAEIVLRESVAEVAKKLTVNELPI